MMTTSDSKGFQQIFRVQIINGGVMPQEQLKL